MLSPHACLSFIIMIKSIKQILKDGPESGYKGSGATKALMEEQIKERWGASELKNYDPLHSARTFNSWRALGFSVKKGEKSLKSYTFIEEEDDDGNVTKKIRRPVSLFYYRQVEAVRKD